MKTLIDLPSVGIVGSSELPMDFRLMRDDVYVEILDSPASDTIIAPDRRDFVPTRGRVLATGPGRRSTKDGRLLPNAVAPGEVIQFYFGGISAYPLEPLRTHAIVEAKHIQAVLEQ